MITGALWFQSLFDQSSLFDVTILDHTESDAELSEVVSGHDNPTLVRNVRVEAVNGKASVGNAERQCTETSNQLCPFLMATAVYSRKNIVEATKKRKLVYKNLSTLSQRLLCNLTRHMTEIFVVWFAAMHLLESSLTFNVWF